jgi:hypothetical protein
MQSPRFGNARRWADATVYRVPCADCELVELCKAEQLACADFRRFVMRPYRPAKNPDRNPTRDTYDYIFGGDDDEVPTLA